MRGRLQVVTPGTGGLSPFCGPWASLQSPPLTQSCCSHGPADLQTRPLTLRWRLERHHRDSHIFPETKTQAANERTRGRQDGRTDGRTARAPDLCSFSGFRRVQMETAVPVSPPQASTWGATAALKRSEQSHSGKHIRTRTCAWTFSQTVTGASAAGVKMSFSPEANTCHKHLG